MQSPDVGEDVRLGLVYVLSVPYVAGFACFGGPEIGGFRLTGWVFVVMLALAPLVYLVDRTPSRFPISYWIPWIAVVLLSILWADEIGRWQLQDALQIVTPFVIAPIASKSIHTKRDMDALMRGFTHCLFILLAATVLYFLASAHVLVRPMALTAALVGCVFIAQVRDKPRTAVFGWLGCLLITGLTGSRIATLALLLEWLLMPGFRRVWPRFAIGAAVVSLGIALFYTPVFQERFFGDDRGTIADVKRGEYLAAGRREAWPELIEDVRRRPWIGSGSGSAMGFVEEVWGADNITQPHNDYLRILLEQGTLGLLCFSYGVIRQLVSLWVDLRTRKDARAAIRSAAILGFLVLLVVAYTDNPIIYGVWFMHPLLVLAGASYSSDAAAATRNSHCQDKTHSKRGLG